MKQILEHFSPAMIYLAISIFLIGIFAFLLATGGPVAQVFENCISSAFTSLQNAANAAIH